MIAAAKHLPSVANSNRNSNPRAASEPVLVRLSDVMPRELEWLWPRRIPLGKITLLAGDPGLGKSFVTLDLASRVTRGAAWPDDKQTFAQKGSVILLSAEDDLEDTICPRLQTARADLTRVVSLTAARSGVDGIVRPLSLSRDLRAVRAALAATPDCRLLIIDPISAYLGDVDGNNNIDVRSLMFPLAELAAEHRLAVVAVTHLNKKAVGKAIYRAMGSLAFVAVARACWGVVCDPADNSRRLMLPVKHNLAPEVKGLSFELKTSGENEMPTVNWDSASVDRPIDELLGLKRAFNADQQSYRDKTGYVAEWLREQLASGPRDRTDLFFWATLAGHSNPQLYRAAEKLGVVKMKKDMNSDSWEWRLSEE